MTLNSVIYEVGDNKVKVDGVAKIKEWMSSETGLNRLAIEFAEKFGQALAEKKLSTAQIRNVFGEVRRIEMKMRESWDEAVETSVLLLRPKLAYSAKRASQKAPIAQELEAVLSAGLKEVSAGKDENDKQRRFQRFADFFEAVLAYHKAYGGKENN